MSNNQASQTKSASEAKKDETHSGSAPQDIQAQLDELKRGFSRLGNREKQLEERELALDSTLKKVPELEKEAAEGRKIKQLLIDQPYEAYKMAGGEPHQIHSKVASGVAEDDPAQIKMKSLEQTIQKLTNTVEQLTQKEIRDQQAKESQNFLSHVEQITKSYPMVKDLEGSIEVIKQTIQAAKQAGKDLSVEDAVKQINEQVKTQVSTLAKHLQPTELPTPAQDKASQTPKSLKDAKSAAMARMQKWADEKKANKKG